jgi:hypothetical protein
MKAFVVSPLGVGRWNGENVSINHAALCQCRAFTPEGETTKLYVLLKILKKVRGHEKKFQI